MNKTIEKLALEHVKYSRLLPDGEEDRIAMEIDAYETGFRKARDEIIGWIESEKINLSKEQFENLDQFGESRVDWL